MAGSTPLRAPKYRLHRPSGLAVVRANGRDIYLGRYGLDASHAEYQRVVGEWNADSAEPSPRPANQIPEMANRHAIRSSKSCLGHLSGARPGFSTSFALRSVFPISQPHFAAATLIPPRRASESGGGPATTDVLYSPMAAAPTGSSANRGGQEFRPRSGAQLLIRPNRESGSQSGEARRQMPRSTSISSRNRRPTANSTSSRIRASSRGSTNGMRSWFEFLLAVLWNIARGRSG